MGETIKADCDGPLDRVARGRWSILYTLDEKTHRPVKIQSDGRWDRYKETQSVTVTAKEAVRHDQEWVAKFTADAEKYFEVTAHFEDARRNDVLGAAIAERMKPGSAGKTLDAWRAHASERATGRDAPAVSRDLDRLLKDADEARRFQAETAKHWAKFAGLPVTEWKATDLVGKEHALGHYRGKVVLLDFWFRQCSWCMRAMPQIDQVEATFRQEEAPVQFLSVSTDEDAADAKFVADTMKLDYPVLRSKKLAEQLGVTVFPTLLVIAPDGTLQGIYLGYRLTLREDLTSGIRGLLK